MRRLTLILLLCAATLAAGTAAAPSARAASPTWNCEASPLHAGVVGLDLTLGLLTANGGATRCQPDSKGLGALTGGLPAGLNAGVLTASTTLTGASGATSQQRPGASAAVADVNLGVTGLVNLLKVDAATSSASASCVAGTPTLTGTSTVGNVYLGGVRVLGLDQPVTVTGNILNGLPVGAVARLVPNEQTLVNGVLTRNALHVTVTLLGLTVLDATLAQSRVSYSGAVCDTTTEQRPAVQVVDSGRNRVVAATVTPPSGRTITSCTVTVTAPGATTALAQVTGTYSATTGRCTATLPRGTVAAGTYDVSVDATDSAGQTGTGTGTITVAAPSVGSPAVAGRVVTAAVAPPAGTALTSCAFDVTSGGGGGGTTTVAGTYDASAGVCRATLPDAVPAGPASVTVRATDANGDVGTATATVSIGAVPPGPAVMLVASGENRTVVAKATPGTGRNVVACTLAVRTAGSTGTFTALPATLSDGGTTCTATLPRASFDPGAYEVRATATDDAGRTGTTTGPVTIATPAVGAPTADDRALSATLAPAAGAPVTACTFVLTPVGGGATRTLDGTVAGGGTRCDATAPAAVTAGVFDVTATARDANGDTGSASAEIQVGTPAPAPTPPTVALRDSGRNRVVVADVAPSAGDTITSCAITARPAGDAGAAPVPLDATYDATARTCTATLAPGAFASGSYAVAVTATDSSGDAATDRGTVRVSAPQVGRPVADGRTITVDVTPAPGTPLVACRVDVDPDDAAPVTLSGTLTGGTCTVTLPDDVAAGNATAVVTVTDANGDSGTGTDDVTLGAVPRPIVQVVDSGANRTVAADVTPPAGRDVEACTVGVRSAGSDGAFTPVAGARYDAGSGRCTATLPAGTFPVGPYDVRVTATDDAGRTGSGAGTVTVAGPDVGTPVISGRTVTVPATAPAGATLTACSFTLTPAGGGAGTDLTGALANGACRATVPDAVAAGDYAVTATVADDQGDRTTTSGTGTVGAAPSGPAVTIADGPRNRTVVATVAPGADPDVTACALQARPAGSSGPYLSLDATLDAAAGTCTATLDAGRFPAGAYEVRATATDAAGRTGTATGPVTVAAPVVGPPVGDEREVRAAVTPAPGVAVDTCTITLTPAAGGGAPQTYVGAFDGPSSSCVLTVPGAVDDGLYVATVTATDAQGDAGSGTAEVRVGSPAIPATPPTVALADSGRNRVALARVSAPAGESVVACVIRARDDDGDLVALPTTYDADAGTCTATLPETAFAPGAHDVRATVTDTTGDTASDEGTITIASPSVGTPTLDGRDVSTPVTPAAGTPIVSCTVTVTPQGGGDRVVLTGTLADGRCVATLPDAVAQGPAVVTVVVTDAGGDDATGSATVTVPAPGGGGGDTGGGDTGGTGGTGGGDTGGGGTGGTGNTGGTGTGGVGGQGTPVPTPATPGSTSTGGVFATGDVTDLLLQCGGRLQLTDVISAGGRVRLSGVAAKQYVGRTVTLKFMATNRRVATATVRSDGTFSARAALPSKRLRTSDRARYQALIGSVHSRSLKLARRTYVTKLAKASGNRIELRGTVTGPRARKAAAVVIQRMVSCGKYQQVATTKLSSSGRFVARFAAPAGVKAALYRVSTHVASKRGGKATARTYSLPNGLRVG